jgi:hypothetical protein
MLAAAVIAFSAIPSAYLLVRCDPIAFITASETKFSDAINSILFCWRFSSSIIAAWTASSTAFTFEKSSI